MLFFFTPVVLILELTESHFAVHFIFWKTILVKVGFTSCHILWNTNYQKVVNYCKICASKQGLHVLMCWITTAFVLIADNESLEKCWKKEVLYLNRVLSWSAWFEVLISLIVKTLYFLKEQRKYLKPKVSVNFKNVKPVS